MKDMKASKILIVEDEAIVAADLAAKLTRLGYEIVGTAMDGLEAVEMTCRAGPDLVLMDIQLEGEMDGIEAAEEIRRRCHAPLIYLTAHSDRETLARAKLTGPFGYILKPFQERELTTQIELALYKHQTERELHRQREWLRVTLTSIGEAVIATDAGGNVTFVNPKAEFLTGWTMEDAVASPVGSVFRVVNEQTGEDMGEPVSQVLREGRPVGLSNHAALVTMDGRRVPVEDSAAPILDDEGIVIGVVLVFRDVTEKRRARERLQGNEERLRLATSAARLGVFEWDIPSDTVTWENERMYEIFGRSHEQGPLTRAGLLEVLDPEDVWIFQRDLTESLRPDKIFSTACRIRRADDGKKRWIEFSGRLESAPDGSARRIIGMVADITERKEMEDELLRSRDDLELRVQERTLELRQSNQALQDFASIASHDLQEPLRKVISFGSILKRKHGAHLGNQGRDYLGRMLNATQRMQSLLKSLLEYSWVTTKAVPFRKVDLRIVMDDVLSDLEVLIDGTGGRVEVGDLPVVSAQPDQMRQLFQNLIGNALKFHKEGFNPVVKVRTIPGCDGGARVVVEDNGIGFDELHLEKIFSPFHRLHGRSSRYDGTGMGLAICKKIVERHGGSITARSRQGEGATFIVDFPAPPSRK